MTKGSYQHGHTPNLEIVCILNLRVQVVKGFIVDICALSLLASAYEPNTALSREVEGNGPVKPGNRSPETRCQCRPRKGNDKELATASSG